MTSNSAPQSGHGKISFAITFSGSATRAPHSTHSWFVIIWPPSLAIKCKKPVIHVGLDRRLLVLIVWARNYPDIGSSLFGLRLAVRTVGYCIKIRLNGYKSPAVRLAGDFGADL